MGSKLEVCANDPVDDDSVFLFACWFPMWAFRMNSYSEERIIHAAQAHHDAHEDHHSGDETPHEDHAGH